MRKKTVLKKICSTIILFLYTFSFIQLPSTVDAATVSLATPVSVKAVSSSYNGIKVNWSGVTGASGYLIYRAASSTGTYSLISTTAGVSYSNTGLVTGTSYYYKIRAYRIVGKNRVYSSFSTVVTSKPILGMPTSVKATAPTYNSIILNWGAVNGASGYVIYRATSNAGTYTLIATTANITYSDTGLATGTSYYYKVRTYRTVGKIRVYSAPSTVISSKPILGAPTSVKSTAPAYNSIKLNWGVVNGASGYVVYRAVSNTGTYTVIATTANITYSDTGLATGTSYYYKISAYRIVGNNKVYSDSSAVATSKPYLMIPTSLKFVSSTYDSINIIWSSVDGASGYAIYRANSSAGTYSMISTEDSTSFTDTGLLSGTAYYYKVSAYRIVDNRKIYSSASSMISGSTLVAVASVSLNKVTDTLILGCTDTLAATIVPANAADKTIFWTSSDNNVVTVDSNGIITSKNAGQATITATTENGSKIASCIVTVNNANIKGIDISKWDGAIDWSSVKSDGVQFAMIRSSYGDGTSSYINNGVDPTFETNYSTAKANGIAIGAYHYSYAKTVTQATKEANFFISKLKGKQFEYPVCVDLEDPSQDSLDMKTLTDIALTYLNILKQAGYYPIIYSSKSWFTSVLDDTRLSTFDHWVAQWGSSITYTGAVGVWQYSSSGTVKGISGNVDMDTSFVDYASRIKYLHLNGF